MGLGILGALGSAVPVVLAGLLAIRIGGVVLDALSEGLLAHEVRKGVLVLGDIRGLAILTLASEGEFFLQGSYQRDVLIREMKMILTESHSFLLVFPPQIRGQLFC